MILLIDNYDSFTWNLVQRLGEIGLARPELRRDIQVVRNDALSVPGIEAMGPSHIIISPGPGRPGDAGISNDVIRHFAARIPILGVCLGHQCIGDVCGGIVERAGRIMHGKTSEIFHDGRTIFAGLPSPFVAARYHSLIIRPGTLNEDFEISAWTQQGEIMAIRHRTWPLEGVQFHPESFLTVEGVRLLENFVGSRNECRTQN